jgi:hypothetical protein
MSTNVQLLVIFVIDDWHGLSARTLLIEHSNVIIWDEDKLRELYHMYLALFNKDHIIETKNKGREWTFIKQTWLLDDTTALMTSSHWRQDGYTFDITISKGIRKDDAMKPLWIPSNM